MFIYFNFLQNYIFFLRLTKLFAYFFKKTIELLKIVFQS